MDGNTAAFYGGVIALGVLGFVMVIICVLCKFYMTSGKYSELKFLSKCFTSHSERRLGNGDITSRPPMLKCDESQFMLDLDKGQYVGYDSLEKDGILGAYTPGSYKDQPLGKLNPIKSNTLNHSLAEKESLMPNKHTTNTDMLEDKLGEKLDVDISDLKVKDTAKSGGLRPRRERTLCQCEYSVIYEETSDLSGSEVRVGEQGEDSEESRSNKSTDDEEERESFNHQHPDFFVTQKLLSHHSEDNGLGQIEYSLQYISESNQVVLHIIQVRNLVLAGATESGSLDCYIKAYANECLEQDPKKQTKLCKCTSNPIFKEAFLFRCTQSDLARASIILQVFSRDQYARQRLLGEACVKLSSLTYTISYRTWINITDYDHQPAGGCAELLLAMHRDPITFDLTISVLRAHISRSPQRHHSADLFITATLVNNNDDLVSRMAGNTVTASDVAVFADTFIFDKANQDTFTDNKLVVEMHERITSTRSKPIAYCVFGLSCTDTALAHWHLINAQKELVTMWHTLSPVN